jgi:hypothetical protein
MSAGNWLVLHFRIDRFLPHPFQFIIRKKSSLSVFEMGGACRTYRGGERCIKFWWGNLRERDRLEDLVSDGIY